MYVQLRRVRDEMWTPPLCLLDLYMTDLIRGMESPPPKK